jgi:type-F conjugative transfer system pilin assembly protein TrbC
MLSSIKNLSLIAFSCFYVFAEVNQRSSASDIEYAKQMNERQKVNLEEFYGVAKELEFVTGKLPVVGKGCENCDSKIQNISHQDTNIENGILVFVSFSMPKASLAKLSKDAQKHDATLVLRGIYRNSFPETKDKILEINPNGMQLDIHPDLFKRYNIKRVPTFVLLRNGREIHRLSGNVTLEFACSRLLEGQ